MICCILSQDNMKQQNDVHEELKMCTNLEADPLAVFSNEWKEGLYLPVQRTQLTKLNSLYDKFSSWASQWRPHLERSINWLRLTNPLEGLDLGSYPWTDLTDLESTELQHVHFFQHWLRRRMKWNQTWTQLVFSTILSASAWHIFRISDGWSSNAILFSGSIWIQHKQNYCVLT